MIVPAEWAISRSVPYGSNVTIELRQCECAYIEYSTMSSRQFEQKIPRGRHFVVVNLAVTATVAEGGRRRLLVCFDIRR